MATSTVNTPDTKKFMATKAYAFETCSSDGEKLFSVSEGVSFRDAFDEVSVLLTLAIDNLYTLAASGETEPKSIYCPLKVLDSVHALVQAMHSGYMAHTKTSVGKGVLAND